MTVVLGYDESPGAQQALKVAVEVALRWGEPMRIVYGAGPPGGPGEESTAHRHALEEIGAGVLGRAAQQVRGSGVEVDVEVVVAKPTEALLRVAETHDATVIVVGTSGEGPFRSALVGSTPHKLLQLSTRPVLCVPPRE